MKQQSLFDKKTKKKYSRTIHGGASSKGHRKEERPFSSKRWLHLILKSEKAKGKLSLKAAKNQVWIKRHIDEMARRFGVKIGDYANVGTHLHIKTRGVSRKQYQRFLKATTGRIAAHVTGARKGKKFGRFWQGLAYTRVLTSGLEELGLKGYFEANRVESARGKREREDFLEDFNRWIRKIRRKSADPPPSPAPAWA
jgi:hypothetical protein